jgi:hypothetical protein
MSSTSFYGFWRKERCKSNISQWDCGSPLYNSCESVTLSHIIERQMMEWPYPGGSKQIITKFSNLDEVMIPKGNGKDIIFQVDQFE